jgi:hypothetical protein
MQFIGPKWHLFCIRLSSPPTHARPKSPALRRVQIYAWQQGENIKNCSKDKWEKEETSVEREWKASGKFVFLLFCVCTRHEFRCGIRNPFVLTQKKCKAAARHFKAPAVPAALPPTFSAMKMLALWNKGGERESRKDVFLSLSLGCSVVLSLCVGFALQAAKLAKSTQIAAARRASFAVSSQRYALQILPPAFIKAAD